MNVQTLSGSGTTETHTDQELVPDRVYSLLATVPVRIAFRGERGVVNAVGTGPNGGLILNGGVEYKFLVRKGFGWASTFIYAEAATGSGAYTLTVSIVSPVATGMRGPQYDKTIIEAPSQDPGAPWNKNAHRLDASSTMTPSLVADRHHVIMNGAGTFVVDISDPKSGPEKERVSIPAYSSYEFMANRSASYETGSLLVERVSGTEAFVIQKD